MNNPTTLGKALEVNLDSKIYGTFAEIGAGQETARCFFQAGKASQTVAKTMSAYDMTFSDEIYGKEESGRYVCESRVVRMLEKEYSLLLTRLKKSRGEKTQFFAFANTVATASDEKKHSHGWIGIRFQSHPQGDYNEIVMHIRTLSRQRLQQQETLGILGVNLVWAAFYKSHKPKEFIPALVDNLKTNQVAIDMIRFRGPDLKHINNHLMNLELVRREYSEAVLFGPQDEILDVSDFIYDKPLVIERGSFRPVTTSHMDLLKTGFNQFQKDFQQKSPIVLFELTMHALQNEGKVDEQDFLDRVHTLTALGHYVLVSNFFLFFKLKSFLRRSTKKPMAMIIGASLLPRLMDEKYYTDLEGGILEGLGKLVDAKTHLYVYPSKNTQSCQTARSFKPSKNLLKLYEYFLDNQYIIDMAECDHINEFIHSSRVLDLIKKKDKSWEKMVPKAAKDFIIKNKMFGI